MQFSHNPLANIIYRRNFSIIRLSQTFCHSCVKLLTSHLVQRPCSRSIFRRLKWKPIIRNNLSVEHVDRH